MRRLFKGTDKKRGSHGTAVTLNAGDTFPRMEWRTVDEETLVLPDDYAGRWTVLLVYRGHW